MLTRPALAPRPRWQPLLAAAAWVLAWLALLLLDGHVDLANLALLLVMASALASVWLPVSAAVAAGVASVLAFNWTFVPPRNSFAVDLHQHALLLLAMLVVNALVAGLVAGQRHQAQRARQHLREAEQLRSLGEALRDTPEPLAHAAGLRDTMSELTGLQATLLLQKPGSPAMPTGSAAASAGPAPADSELLLGEADADELAGLQHCLRQRHALGPGTGRHDELAAWYLPLRGRDSCHGAALLRLPQHGQGDPALCRHAQALCDQMGQALQRVRTSTAEAQAREQAQLQAVRNALLAAISHDFRTPLATMLGAASSLQEQGERLAPEQRRRLADSLVDEIGQLARLADNTLQLARLDAPGVLLQRDWESAEEIVGEVLRRARRRDTQRRVRARLEPDLPLLRCDALLLTQLLDNLVDNALKYSPADSPVEILVRRQPAHPAQNPSGTPSVDNSQKERLLIAVRDRGPGVPSAWRERIFDVFQRGEAASTDTPPLDSARPGAGVGLAVCRAIARAHGGELRLRARGHGGCSFEFQLEIDPPPAGPSAPAAKGDGRQWAGGAGSTAPA